MNVVLPQEFFFGISKPVVAMARARAPRFERLQGINDDGVCRAISLMYLEYVLGCNPHHGDRDEFGRAPDPMPEHGWIPEAVFRPSERLANELYDESDFAKTLSERREPAPFLLDSMPSLVLFEKVSDLVNDYDEAMQKVLPFLEQGLGFVFSFYYYRLDEDGEPKGAHAIAIDVTGHPAGSHVMDPNRGVWQFRSIEDLIVWMKDGELVSDRHGRRVKKLYKVRLVQVTRHE